LSSDTSSDTAENTLARQSNPIDRQLNADNSASSFHTLIPSGDDVSGRLSVLSRWQPWHGVRKFRIDLLNIQKKSFDKIVDDSGRNIHLSSPILFWTARLHATMNDLKELMTL
jgi:hypothetical protein